VGVDKRFNPPSPSSPPTKGGEISLGLFEKMLEENSQSETYKNINTNSEIAGILKFGIKKVNPFLLAVSLSNGSFFPSSERPSLSQPWPG
jgi:hypothetical protein